MTVGVHERWAYPAPLVAPAKHVPITVAKSAVSIQTGGARCSSVVRAFAHGVMGRRINPSWIGPTELFLVPPSAPRLV